LTKPSNLLLPATLLAATLTFVPAGTGSARSAGPSVRTIERLLARAYCAPARDPQGRPMENVQIVLQQVDRSRRRVRGRTTFFPIAALYTCTLTSTDGRQIKTRKLRGSYLFFRNRSGHWVQKNARHTVEETTVYR
jgi:hypothetical protein